MAFSRIVTPFAPSTQNTSPYIERRKQILGLLEISYELPIYPLCLPELFVVQNLLLLIHYLTVELLGCPYESAQEDIRKVLPTLLESFFHILICVTTESYTDTDVIGVQGLL